MRDFSGIEEPRVYTFNDLTNRLVLRTGSGGMSTPAAKSRHARAIQDSIRSLPSKHDWSYFSRQTRFYTSPARTMTVSYLHSGGSHERLLTVTDGDFWPPDATYGEIRIGEFIYRIEKRINDLQATLEDDFSLSSNWNGEVTWERRAYTLGRTVTKVHYVQDISRDRPIPFMSRSEFMSSSYTQWGHGDISRFTWQNHGNRFGSSEFILLPAPAHEDLIEVSATVNPLIPKIVALTGTGCSVVQGSNTVETNYSNLTNKVVGAVFRLATDNAPPSSDIDDDWEFEAFITKVIDHNTIELSEPSPLTAEDRGYIISSPIDIDADVMLEYVEDEAFAQYCKNHDHKSYDMAKMITRESLTMARARDNKVSMNSRMWDRHWSSSSYSGSGFYTVDLSLHSDSKMTSEQTFYLDELPANSIGNNGDQVKIIGGNLEGALYEKRDDVWTYITIFNYALRSSHPDTSSVPTGFKWRLVGQSDSANNGIYEWNGTTINQITDE